MITGDITDERSSAPIQKEWPALEVGGGMMVLVKDFSGGMFWKR